MSTYAPAVIRMKLSGVSFRPEYPRNLLITPDIPDYPNAAEIRPEPDNPHDPLAVGVWLLEDEWMGVPACHVGYVPAIRLPEIREALSLGRYRAEVIVARNARHPDRPGAVLVLTRTEDLRG